MKRVTIAIVAVIAVALIAIPGWYYYSTTKPVAVTGTIIIRGYTLVPTYPYNMTWTNSYDQRVYVAGIWDIHGNVGSYNVTVPSGNYTVQVWYRGQTSPESYFIRHITVPSGDTYSRIFENP